MRGEQIDLTERFRRAHDALAQCRRSPVAQERTGRNEYVCLQVFAVIAVIAVLALAFRISQRDTDHLRAAFVADTSSMVQLGDGTSRTGDGHFFVTAVRTSHTQPAQLTQARLAMNSAKRSAIRAALACVDPSARRNVSIDVGDLAGASGGLMLALTIVDALDPSGVTGSRIAGTGTITPDGVVGRILEVGVKAQAARDAHADMFLVPRSQVAEAARFVRDLRIVGVRTLDEAVRSLGHDAGCSGSSRGNLDSDVDGPTSFSASTSDQGADR